MIPLIPLPPWLTGKLVGYAAGALAVGLFGWWLYSGWCNGACEKQKALYQTHLVEAAQRYADAVEREYQRAQDERQAKDEIARKSAAQLDEERATNEALRRQLARERSVTRPEPTDENPDPDVRLAGGWLQCWAAVAGADPADVAACQVRSHDLPVERPRDGAGGL